MLQLLLVTIDSIQTIETMIWAAFLCGIYVQTAIVVICVWQQKRIDSSCKLISRIICTIWSSETFKNVRIATTKQLHLVNHPSAGEGDHTTAPLGQHRGSGSAASSRYLHTELAFVCHGRGSRLDLREGPAIFDTPGPRVH